ncbi:helix-turn-helix transcriptional regulator [Phaeobacter gallaeciensis]|uniref:helix-turn-helix transcriptional regulator n=1 Tax=Phaeobacter gallaeciensis TaxID=60890 RepID=UPI0003D6B26D|nr:LuxR family transcriptional regulator [Phaeobacter gallaeciensis]AHD12163.1 Response regulator [Phaeobacter gallaeciensis DSM 26640]ATE95347.1 Response regulator [Phaeobacter gallaeciensis]
MDQEDLMSKLHNIADNGVAIGFGFSESGQPTEHICTYPQAWQNHYWEHNLIFDDPVISFGVRNLGAVRWDDVSKGTKGNAVQQAKDFGMNNGIVISIQVDGERAIAGLATSKNPSDAEISEARIILAALQAAKTGKPQIILTPRQRDILRLIADGATAEDAAHELNIEPSTVNFHKRQALHRNRKHAKNFTSLLIKAVRDAAI